MAALRVLTGVLFIGGRASDGGSVTLDFNNWGNGNLGDAFLGETNESGASGPFVAAPGKVVSLRYFSEEHLDSSINLTDSIPTQNDMTISWATTRADVREISVCIVGEA